MRRFLRENWLWILVPVILVIAGLVVIVLAVEGGRSDTGPFEYRF